MAQKFFSTIIALVALCGLLAGAATAQSVSVLTQHNDISRSGQNLNETLLTTANVNQSTFGKVFSYAVDGQIYAQPLYMPNLTIGGATHNVVFVATENDSLYAFDADYKSSAPLWHRSFLRSKSVTPVPCGTDGNTTDISCNVFPYYGITGTPVINPATNTMYLVVRTAETVLGVVTYYQRLHAVNILTGADKFGGAVAITGSVPGTGTGCNGGTCTFDPLADIQRTGLLFLNNTVYIGWAGAAHGWIMGFNATTLKRTAIFNTTPNAVLGGIWQTGNGLAADGTTSTANIYVAVGDATFDANTGGTDYGDTLLKLNQKLVVEDYFTPMDELCRTTGTNDLDLGSAGPILLPTQGGTYPNELLISGKGGSPCDSSGFSPMYLVDRDNLGKYNANSDNIIQELNGAPGGYWSNPAFWQGTGNGTSYLYLAGTGPDGNGPDYLDQYSVVNGVIANTGHQSTNQFNVGATPSTSSNGTSDGIVWAIERTDSLDLQPGDSPAILWAYDATNVSTNLYNSNMMTNGRDQPGCGNKFQAPTIANGRVYVGTQTELDVYGLLGTNGNPPGETLVIGSLLGGPCNTFPSGTVIGTKSTPQVFSLSNIGTTAITITSITATGANAADFPVNLAPSGVPPCGKSIAAGATCGFSVTFAPTLATPEVAFVTIKDSSVGSPHTIGLGGTGDSPSVLVTPPYLAFGKQDVGIASATQAVTVANSGNLTVTVNGVTITGTNASYFSQTNDCSSVAVGANCTITVTFTPQATGQFSANLNVADNATGSPQVVSLTGVGVQPNAGISPTVINFGMVTVGSSSSSQPVTLTNTGGGSLVISSITFTGPAPGDFSQTNNCKGSVASGGSCTINVTFKPTTQGTRQAYLNVNDNSSPSPQQVSLSGDGT